MKYFSKVRKSRTRKSLPDGFTDQDITVPLRGTPWTLRTRWSQIVKDLEAGPKGARVDDPQASENNLTLINPPPLLPYKLFLLLAIVRKK